MPCVIKVFFLVFACKLAHGGHCCNHLQAQPIAWRCYVRNFSQQHIALICDDLYACWDDLKKRGVPFMTAPPETYYKMLSGRLPGHRPSGAAGIFTMR